MKKNLCSPLVIGETLKRYGFKYTKALGQNFLTDAYTAERLADMCRPDKKTGVIEVGPGFGAMTSYLAEKAGDVTAVELDRKLIPILYENLSGYDNIKIVNGDILKTDLEELASELRKNNERVYACANLPYYITTEILTRLLESEQFDEIGALMQSEASERLFARPGNEMYRAFTVLVNVYSEPEFGFKVPASSFTPEPNVESSSVKLKIRKNALVPKEERKEFFKIVKASFMKRRKTLVNALSGLYSREKVIESLHLLGFDEKVRGEVMSAEEFLALERSLVSMK